MKKFIALLVCLLITLGLAACGGQPAAPKEEAVAAPAAETQQAIETTEAVETTAAAETEVPTEAPVEVPAFDTGWAGDEYVMPVPAPPFNVFSVNFSSSQNLYIIQDDSDISARAEYGSLSAYCDALLAAGFENIEKEMLSADAFQSELGSVGASTMFSASNASGYRVMVYQEESTPMVWVYCP